MISTTVVRYDTVTLLTDYGARDEFVGVLKSVVWSIAPHVRVVDLCHEITPFDVRAGGLMLARSAQYLCPGVVVAVVDPGVGTDRRAIAVEVGDGMSVLVGPDNGLLAPAVAMVGGASRVVELTNPDAQLPAPGPTFAGRDVFAPAAAHLCAGLALDELGPRIDPASLLPGLLPISREEDGGLEAEVLWRDHYGNLQLNVDPVDVELMGERVAVVLAASGTRRVARRIVSFAELGTGELGLMVDSYGLLSVVANRAGAAEELRIDAGDAVRLEPLADTEQGSGPGHEVIVPLGRRGG